MVDAEEFSEDADIDDVGNQLGEFWIDLSSQCAHRDRVGDDVFAFHGLLLGVAVPNDHGAGLKGLDVLFPRGGIDQDLNVRAVAGCLVAFVRESNDVPRWKP